MTLLSSILLVDDDSTTNYLNKILLLRLGVTQQQLAENGREALGLLAQTDTAPSPPCPALILLDLNMPVMGGLEFLEAYRHLHGPQRLALVLLLTTSASPRDLVQVQGLPVAGTRTKPLNEAKVRDLLDQYFPPDLASV